MLKVENRDWEAIIQSEQSKLYYIAYTVSYLQSPDQQNKELTISMCTDIILVMNTEQICNVL